MRNPNCHTILTEGAIYGNMKRKTNRLITEADSRRLTPTRQLLYVARNSSTAVPTKSTSKFEDEDDTEGGGEATNVLNRSLSAAPLHCHLP